MKKTNVCPKCGGTDIVKVPLGILDAAPVDRFVCCTCGYSEEWLRKSNLDDIRERWAKKPK